LFTIFCKNQINNLNKKSASFIRTGYKGGRTEIFQPFTTIQNNEHNLYYIDFKSFYPAIALLLPIPVGKMIYTLTYKYNKLGIYLCRIFFYKTDILPYLSVTINENKELVFPNGL
jgi:hypothetical protein